MHNFHFKATGIGSVPSTDIKGTCLNILEKVPDIPFWPQLVKRSHLEDMNIQFSEGLPALVINEEQRSLSVRSVDLDTELTGFYEHYLSDDIDYFRISRDYALGLYEMIELISMEPDRYGQYIKGHIVGPATFAAGIMANDGKSVLYNPDLLEAYTKGLAIKAWWQEKELAKSGKDTIIFLDEPYLSGFGSAFSPIERHEVIELLREVVVYLKERSETLVGIHCCGNTDWSMILESGPDIVNFDAFGYTDYFLLYPDDIKRFLENGGIIAWGIVPTHDFSGEETIEILSTKLQDALNRLQKHGIDPELISANSILTPACGMGSMEQTSSLKVLELLSDVSKKMK